MNQIKESDWKVMRRVAPTLVERFCQRYLDSIAKIIRTKQSSFERYQDVYRATQQHNRSMQLLFDDMRRSSAFELVISWRDLDLLTEEEFSLFSEDLQQRVDRFLGRA
jgi:hypothetical protein